MGYDTTTPKVECSKHRDAADADKLFKPQVEKELKDFMAAKGYDTTTPKVECSKSIPGWGQVVLINGVVTVKPIQKPVFGMPTSLGLVLSPEPPRADRKKKLPASGLVKKKMKIHRFGTLRRHAATFSVSSALGIRGCRDFANGIFYSTKYKKAMLGRTRGKFVNPCLAEWVMGHHRNWTSTSGACDAPPAQQREGRITTASLFSGVAGIEVGVAKTMKTTLYCECDAAAQAVLHKRISDKHIDAGEVRGLVQDVTEDDLQDIDCITAGFPCPDIALPGSRVGLGGQRSSLFREVIKAAVKSGCKYLFLENVAHLISDEMKAVFLQILAFTVMLGFRNIRWAKISAADVGSPQMRKRWFLLAWKNEGDLAKLKRLTPQMNSGEITSMASKPWNPGATVDVAEWLVQKLEKGERERLLQLGNGVVPKCAEVALSLLVHAQHA